MDETVRPARLGRFGALPLHPPAAGMGPNATILARRWLNVGELPLSMSWKCAFVATRLTSADMDAAEGTLRDSPSAAATAPRTKRPPVAPGVSLWRIRDYFLRAAPTLDRTSRTLTVKLAAASWPSK